jgi:integrase
MECAKETTMASIHNRGTKDHPNWYAIVKDASGKWVQRRTGVRKPGREGRREAQQKADEIQAAIDSGKPDPSRAPTCGELMEQWLSSLKNRNAPIDKYSTRKHLIPVWDAHRPAEIDHTDIVRWLDRLRAAEKPLSGATQITLLGLMSRFYSWAIARRYATTNPVRAIPRVERPKPSPKAKEWVRDDAHALDIAAALPSPLGLMYFIGYRCGLRPGEVAGLRMDDLAELDLGTIRVAHNEDGLLKEDRGVDEERKVKFAPAPPDIIALLTSWAAKREDDGAEGDDFVFRAPKPTQGKDRGFYTRLQRSRAWRALPASLRGDLEWYTATRHSFTSRNLEAGVPLDEVSAALGHADTRTTRRHYALHIKRRFSDAIRRPLQLENAKVIPFPGARSSG